MKKTFGRNSIALLFLPKVCLFTMLFSCNVAHTIKDDGRPIREHIDVFQGGDTA